MAALKREAMAAETHRFAVDVMLAGSAGGQRERALFVGVPGQPLQQGVVRLLNW